MSDTTSTDLLFRPVDELAGLVRSGEVAARELVQASLDRIDEVNGEVNAFVDVFADDALAAAGEVGPGDDRPLAGVPIAIKNNTPVAGRRLTFASGFLGDFTAPFDAALVRRLREAGAIVVGTTTLPEWGIQPATETRRFGATRNPWDLSRTPGGSSGGSAAAVAAGMLPIAHGNDGGGSTRIPAACCGLVGLKPSRGRISMAPAVGEQFLGNEGVLTRTVRETALVLDLLAGPEPGDASWAPAPSEPFAASAAKDPGTLRIGVCVAPPLPDTPVSPEVTAAARAAGELLEDLGHHVEELGPPFESADLFRAFTAVFGPMVCSQALIGVMAAGGREPTLDDVERLSLWLWETCRGIDSISAYAATVQLQATGRQLVAWSAPYDVVLTPALAEAPVPVGTLAGDREDPEGTFRRAGQFTPFTPAVNISGQPAISVPLFEDEDGLPLGIQLIGRPLGEGTLLSLAAQLEAARPWAGRRAPLGLG